MKPQSAFFYSLNSFYQKSLKGIRSKTQGEALYIQPMKTVRALKGRHQLPVQEIDAKP